MLTLLLQVGNQAFADFVDGTGRSVTHINNKEDPVPIVPPISFGFHHPSGEVHIEPTGDWDACPGKCAVDLFFTRDLVG